MDILRPMPKALAVAALLSLAASARADRADDEIARAHFATGVSYYDSGRYDSAVKEFREAYRLSHRPLLLFNIARAYEKMGDAGRASGYYRRYLESEPSTNERTDIELKLAQFAPRVGELVVHSDPPGAEILIDGDEVGTAPLGAQPLTVGKHEVIARSDRFAPISGTVQVNAGATVTVTVDQRNGRLRGEGATTTAAPGERPRWLWPVIGSVGAAVVVAVVLGLVLGLGTGTDFNAFGRGTCGMGCTVVEFK